MFMTSVTYRPVGSKFGCITVQSPRDVLTRCARVLNTHSQKEDQVQTEHRIACMQYICEMVT